MHLSTIYTVGHSNKSCEEFIDALRHYQIERVIDVRTIPYSRWNPQFNREDLAYCLAAFDINYDWRGSNLGGLKINIDYRKTLSWVIKLSLREKVALMCSEKDYKKCHRYTMLTPDLEELGATISHIGYENGREGATDLLQLF